MDPAVTPSPDELLRRVVAVAQSGQARDLAVSERLLGLRWQASQRSSDAPIFASIRTDRPAWLDPQYMPSAHLNASAPGRPTPPSSYTSWQVLMDLQINAETVCIPPDMVMRDFASRGEWRLARTTGFFTDYRFFAVRPGNQAGGEIWFRFGHPVLEGGRQSQCVLQMSVVQECRGRCSSGVMSPPNVAVFGPGPSP